MSLHHTLDNHIVRRNIVESIIVKFPTEVIHVHVGNGTSYYNTKIRKIYWEFITTCLEREDITKLQDIDPNITSNIEDNLIYIANAPIAKINTALDTFATKVKKETLTNLNSYFVSNINKLKYTNALLSAIMTEEINYIVIVSGKKVLHDSFTLSTLVLEGMDENNPLSISSELIPKYQEHTSAIVSELNKYICRYYPFMKVFCD